MADPPPRADRPHKV
uniref:Uncharacterized protein n=1 Tax=Arundo donax TaxID=35708 RepID=A0A0A8Z934_ARUDO